ncbi:DMT family transporter [Kineococcus rhizosphaerae]|uniref:Drug/metabolite transporter (DMT)-like permease n=1 Tax=Kineococcus rhizosphaerae TaxID=559628 RepID=A0A2T0R068_9ACTN|nr:DMT family transporter [Kineococcus rhizosphaerae]PRY12517.1 drug/metabolite transporter (DMT)-like permease [Kineococcus rhizosphaerae]
MTRRAALMFAALGVAWGIPYLLIKVAGDELAPSTLVLARTAVAALVLAPIALSRKEVRDSLPTLARHWKAVVAYTGFEIVGPWLFLARAEHDLPSSTTAVIISAVPVVGAVLALATRRSERLGGLGWAGLALGTLGVATLVGFDLVPTQFGAVAELAVVVVGYAVGPAILARHLSELPGMAVVLASLVLSALVYVPVVALGPGLPDAVSAPVVASVVVLALVCTAGAFLLLFALVGEIGPVRSTSIVYVNPVVAVVAGAVVLGERITLTTVAGFALVLAGSFLTTRGPREPARNAPGQPAAPLTVEA